MITDEGFTSSPNGTDVENVQILAFIDAEDSESALLMFEESYLDNVKKLGFREYRCFPED